MKKFENRWHIGCISTLCIYCQQTKGFNQCLATQIQNEQDYWGNALRTVVSVVKFLASQDLPFKGSDEKVFLKMQWNLLGIIEFLAQYNVFLADHLQYTSLATRELVRNLIYPQEFSMNLSSWWPDNSVAQSLLKSYQRGYNRGLHVRHYSYRSVGVYCTLCHQNMTSCRTFPAVHGNGGTRRRIFDTIINILKDL